MLKTHTHTHTHTVPYSKRSIVTICNQRGVVLKSGYSFLNKGVMALILIRLITLHILHARALVCTHIYTHNQSLT